MKEITWKRYPWIIKVESAQTWIQIQHNLGLAPNTVEAYARALNEFIKFCADREITVTLAKKEHVALYVRNLLSRSHLRPNKPAADKPSLGLANATIHQRLTAIRLFYDFLIEEGRREINPVGRGRRAPILGLGISGIRGLVPRYHKLPRIPTDEEWRAIIGAIREESLRNRFMFVLSYDAALRREELCSLQTNDIDPAHRTVRVRAETTKSRRTRVVPFSSTAAQLYHCYLNHRRSISTARGPLFISESRRNKGQGVSKWSWSKIILALSNRSGVEHFSTHTLRHVCLTDLARDGWDLHDIATFAGHTSIQTTLIYIHLSGRDLAEKLAAGMDAIHARRLRQMESL